MTKKVKILFRPKRSRSAFQAFANIRVPLRQPPKQLHLGYVSRDGFDLAEKAFTEEVRSKLGRKLRSTWRDLVEEMQEGARTNALFVSWLERHATDNDVVIDWDDATNKWLEKVQGRPSPRQAPLFRFAVRDDAAMPLEPDDQALAARIEKVARRELQRRGGMQSADADEIVSDVLLRVVRRIEEGVELERLDAYVRVITSSAWVDMLRRRRSRSPESLYPSMDRVIEDQPLSQLDRIAAHEADSIERDLLRWLLERLDRHDRRMVELRLEGRRFDEISDQLGMSERSVRRHWSGFVLWARRQIEEEMR